MISDDDSDEHEEDTELEPIEETEPNEVADDPSLVETYIPEDVRDKYEVLSYRGAVVLLALGYPEEFGQLLHMLRSFSITTKMIRMPGGNESEVPKVVNRILRPLDWRETIIRGDLRVRRISKRLSGTKKNGKPTYTSHVDEMQRNNYIDGHKIDYVKGKVAFDLEWNSKDQTFDRDLYAFNAFHLSGVIDVGVLLTRGASLTAVLRELGPALDKKGNPASTLTIKKYGASTTWWGKLVYRLNAGRNGGCPVLAVGIRPACIEDWPPKEI
ncbi:BglII/BstYI family type II restriction endonuclease [Afifella sp. IM 167]|uniref:BglII/BstYI family type II restriction endonuclease n=1 Tax=Afifella sp. IM 167 TaxID=2033586 RepID=UPI001CCA06B6|nr:BglII/BstYI family type II restriction endonuclease [Afifella sp. IM 167]MBZ8131680.1 restriction endonuclease [Afifella sp. IM 167]